MATSSGLAATCLIVNLLKAGDHILCCDDVYGGFYVCLSVCLYAFTYLSTTFVCASVNSFYEYLTIKSCNFGSSFDAHYAGRRTLG